MSETVKNKIRQLYKFLKEANQLRFRPVRQLSDQPRVVRLADLPDHPATQLYRPVRVEQTQEVPDTLLRVKRPTITRCPAPPESIASWLLPGWNDPTKLASYVESQNRVNEEGETITLAFRDDEQRVADFESWLVLCQVYFDGIYNQTLPMGKGIRKVWLWQRNTLYG